VACGRALERCSSTSGSCPPYTSHNCSDPGRSDFGATLATRHQTLDAIGGFESIADGADDYRLAERTRDLGLATELSITLDTAFCIEAGEEAMHRHGRPEIFNTDQGCQFTSDAFTRVLKDAGIAISMDGKGCWRDNVFVERLLKTIKYEEVYLKAYDTVSHARQSLAHYIDFYNTRRPHSRLDRRTPDQVYFNQPLPLPKAA
jgi:transposase InsO family protein